MQSLNNSGGVYFCVFVIFICIYVVNNIRNVKVLRVPYKYILNIVCYFEDKETSIDRPKLKLF